MPSHKKSRSRKHHRKSNHSTIRKNAVIVSKRASAILKSQQPMTKALAKSLRHQGVSKRLSGSIAKKVATSFRKKLHKTKSLKRFFSKSLAKEYIKAKKH